MTVIKLAALSGLLVSMLKLSACMSVSHSPGVFVDSGLRLNQLQSIGTHNSYHIAPDKAIVQLLKSSHLTVSGVNIDERLKSLDYTHLSLTQQLELGMRHFEIDVYQDNAGGRFASPAVFTLLQQHGLEADGPYDREGELKKPGFKVIHLADIDVRSTCLSFRGCLKQIKRWSDQNPGHVPIMIQIEAKQSTWPLLCSGCKTATIDPFTADSWRALEQEILSVFSREHIITPDLVQGNFSTLNRAVIEQGWPMVRDVAGKILFAVDNTDQILDHYIDGAKDLRGRLLFASFAPGHPAAAWLKRNDPFDAQIPELVRQGYLIRTRADANTEQARTNDASHKEQAMASGAQFISTDYPVADKRWSDYQVRFDNAAFTRCNRLIFRGQCPLKPLVNQ